MPFLGSFHGEAKGKVTILGCPTLPPIDMERDLSGGPGLDIVSFVEGPSEVQVPC